jgi:hypothetical protein
VIIFIATGKQCLKPFLKFCKCLSDNISKFRKGVFSFGRNNKTVEVRKQFRCTPFKTNLVVRLSSNVKTVRFVFPCWNWRHSSNWQKYQANMPTY